VVRTDRYRGTQYGKEGATNGSHILDWEFLIKVLPTVRTQGCLSALERFMNSTRNLPVKTRQANMKEDLPQDKSIIKAWLTGVPITDPDVKARRDLTAAYIVGHALDYGLPEYIVCTLLTALGATQAPEGAISRYPVVFRGSKPVNIWKDLPRAEVGLNRDGTPDGHTSVGKLRISQGLTQAQMTGLAQDKTPDMRTTFGLKIGVAVADVPEAVSGLKKDGTPSLRTKLGKQIAEKQEARVQTRETTQAATARSKAEAAIRAEERAEKDAEVARKRDAATAASRRDMASMGQQRAEARASQEKARAGSTAEATTGLKKDGTPSMRTKLGKQLVEVEAAQRMEAAQRVEAARLMETARLEAEAARRMETARLEAEAARRKETARLEAEAAQRMETARLEAEAARRMEKARLEAEAARRREAARLEAEAARRRETARLEAARREAAQRAQAEAAQRRQAEEARRAQAYQPPAYSAPASAVGVYQSNGSANGRTLYEGPRGRTYYMTASGNKKYC